MTVARLNAAPGCEQRKAFHSSWSSTHLVVTGLFPSYFPAFCGGKLSHYADNIFETGGRTEPLWRQRVQQQRLPRYRIGHFDAHFQVCVPWMENFSFADDRVASCVTCTKSCSGIHLRARAYGALSQDRDLRATAATARLFLGTDSTRRKPGLCTAASTNTWGRGWS